MRYLNKHGKIAWKASPRFLMMLADANAMLATIWLIGRSPQATKVKSRPINRAFSQ